MRGKILLAAGLFAATPLAAQVQMPAPPATEPEHGDTPPVDYSQATNWICRPGVDDGTCSANLDATKIDTAGARRLAPHVVAKDPPIDCFYVYPTTSRDTTLYSDLVPDAEERRSVHGQAARLGAKCRLFVPVYHQLTMAALAGRSRIRSLHPISRSPIATCLPPGNPISRTTITVAAWSWSGIARARSCSSG